MPIYYQIFLYLSSSFLNFFNQMGVRALPNFLSLFLTSYPYQSKVPYISIQHKYCIKVKRGTVNG